MLYQTRIDRLDILKGIGIIMVLLGHTYIGDAPHMVIYNCHMALFFFVSGFFYKQRSVKEELSLSFKRLIIPFFFFLLLWTIENLSLAVVTRTFESFAIFSSNYRFLDENCSYLYASIWFLIALFLVRISFGIIFNAVNIDVIRIIICLCLYVLGYLLRVNQIDLPLFIDTSFSVSIFFCLGYYFKKTGLFKIKIKLWQCSLLLAAYIAICLLLSPIVDLKTNVFPLYSIVLTSLGIYSLYQLSFEVESKGKVISSILKYLGCISLSLFGLHRLFFKFFSIFLENMGVHNIAVNVIVVVITIVCIIPIDRLLTKYCPVVLGKSSKA